jgi:hypothetical protein
MAPGPKPTEERSRVTEYFCSYAATRAIQVPISQAGEAAALLLRLMALRWSGKRLAGNAEVVAALSRF